MTDTAARCLGLPGSLRRAPRSSVRLRRTLLMAAALPQLLAAGCGSPAGERAPAARDAPVQAVTEQTAQWSGEGLESQPRLELLRERSRELGFEPGTTPWRAAPDAMRQAAADTVAAASPGAAASRLAAALGWTEQLGDAAWEQTTRVWFADEDRAIVVVLQWGLLDDAVAGHDLRVELRRVDGAWQVETVEERFHCQRRVTDEGLCA